MEKHLHTLYALVCRIWTSYVAHLRISQISNSDGSSFSDAVQTYRLTRDPMGFRSWFCSRTRRASPSASFQFQSSLLQTSTQAVHSTVASRCCRLLLRLSERRLSKGASSRPLNLEYCQRRRKLRLCSEPISISSDGSILKLRLSASFSNILQDNV